MQCDLRLIGCFFIAGLLCLIPRRLKVSLVFGDLAAAEEIDKASFRVFELYVCWMGHYGFTSYHLEC